MDPMDVQSLLRAGYEHDSMGREQEAIAYYDEVWARGVPQEERRTFLVAYGSTLRNVGRTEESLALLTRASEEEPAYAPFKIFLALAFHSSGDHRRAMAAMLGAILDVSRGAGLDGFDRAIGEYRDEMAR